jgi:phage tail tape-measure protein
VPVGTFKTIGGYMMVVDQCVRLGMALVIIALVSLALYQFSGRGHVNAQEINQVLAPASGAAASHGRN